jgi:hypothetical protein
MMKKNLLVLFLLGFIHLPAQDTIHFAKARMAAGNSCYGVMRSIEMCSPGKCIGKSKIKSLEVEKLTVHELVIKNQSTS